MHTSTLRFSSTVRLLLLLVLCSAARTAISQTTPPASPLDKVPTIVVPFRYDPLTCPVPVIQIRLNNKPPMSFVLDTGSYDTLILEKWAAESLELPKLKEKTFPYDKKLKAEFVGIQRMEILTTDSSPALNIEVDRVLSMDLNLPSQMLGPSIAGIAGLAWFVETTARFDFVANTLSFFTAPHPPLSTQGAVHLPMKIRDQYTPLRHVTLKIGEKDQDMLIDTGSVSTVMPASFASVLEPQAIGFSSNKTFTIDGWKTYQTLLLSQLPLGEFKEPNVAVDLDKGRTPRAQIGMNLLSRFRVTLDFRNEQMTLERATNHAQRSQVIGSTGGIEGGMEKGQYYVTKVAHGSAAEKAGVKVNDRLIRVDGQSLTKLPSILAGNVLAGYAGTQAEIVLGREKDGKEEQITVRFERGSKYTPKK